MYVHIESYPIYFTVYVYVCVQTNVCVPLYSAKGIDDVALNKK